MAKREITDCLGRSTGARIARYIWRSKPTRSPLTGRPVRCILAQDEKGRLWAGTRIGRGGGQKAQHEFWLEPCETQQQGLEWSRDETRAFLSAEAELYASRVAGKKPHEEIVRVEMDDGWCVSINEAGRITPEERKVMALLDQIGKDKSQNAKAPDKQRTRQYPSR